MRGKTNEEIACARAQAIEDVKARLGADDVEIIDSMVHENPPEGVNAPLWYLGESIQHLAKADVAYFGAGYLNARGCLIEYRAAMDYGIKVITCCDPIPGKLDK